MMRRSELGRLRAALDQEAPPPRPGLAAWVLGARPEPRRRNREWVMGAAAIALVIAIVAGLVYGGRLNTRHTAGAPGAQTTVAVSNVNFKCTLPLVVDGTPAFLTLPDGKLTIAKTTEHGRDLRFDYPAGRWLPGYMEVWPGDSSRGGMTAPIAISPDGQSYAYLAGKEKKGLVDSLDVHVRELASGRDRIVYRGLGHDPDIGGAGSLLGWSTSGIYVTTVAEMGGNPDVYLIDPSSKASPRRVGPNPPIPPYRFSPQAPYSMTTANFTSINGGYAWGFVKDIITQGTSVTGSIARISRMDLRNGVVETWYSNPKANYTYTVAFDSQGHPYLTFALRDDPASYQLYLSTDVNQVVNISSLANGVELFGYGGVLGDAHGAWIGGAGSLWLYTPDGHLVRVVTFPTGFFPTPPPTQKMILLGVPDPTSYPNYVQPAGPCR